MKKLFIILSFVAIVATVGSLFINNKANSIFSQNVEALSGTVICFNTYVCAHDRDPYSSHDWYAYPDQINPYLHPADQPCAHTKCVTKGNGLTCVSAVHCLEWDD